MNAQGSACWVQCAMLALLLSSRKHSSSIGSCPLYALHSFCRKEPPSCLPCQMSICGLFLCRISMTERKGLGRVHDGFYGALFHEDEESGSLFDDVISAISKADPSGKLPIYLAGASRFLLMPHGLG